MNRRRLAPIYMNNELVRLKGEPRPLVAMILAACGKRPDKVEVRKIVSTDDPDGQPVRFEEVIDRTDHTIRPIYLRCVDRAGGDAPTPATSGSKVARAPSP